MLKLAIASLSRRPLRTILTAFGLAVAVAVLGCLSAFGDGYRQALWTELDRMGMQMMLVPLGCPYDAAARVLKGHTLDNSLPAAAVDAARRDPAVAVAAPLLMAAVPRPEEGRTDLWVGLDRSSLQLKPWWHAREGKSWFDGPNSVILGSEAASTEMRQPGDLLYSPETHTTLRVAGVLQRSGTSDDSLFFVPLTTAQRMFGQQGHLTAVAIRLKDPALLPEASQRLQQIRGAQTVTMTEMMGTFLNLVGSVRMLLLAIALIAVTASALSVFNTLLGNVLEQMAELSLMRALGASRAQVFALVVFQALLVTGAGAVAGLALAAVSGTVFQSALRGLVPFAPAGPLAALTLPVALQCLAVGVGAGVLGCLYPAWQAARAAPASAAGAVMAGSV